MGEKVVNVGGKGDHALIAVICSISRHHEHESLNVQSDFTARIMQENWIPLLLKYMTIIVTELLACLLKPSGI